MAENETRVTANEGDKIDPTVRLAIERTELALERTHLAWVRTVIGLITSGFAIDQLVEAFRQKKLIAGEAVVRQAHIAGLILTISGTILLVVAVYYYQKRRKELVKERHGLLSRVPPALVLSALIFLMGLALIYIVAKSE